MEGCEVKDPTDGVDLRARGGLTALLLAIAAWGAIDVALDQPRGLLSFHVIFEIGFVLLCLGSVLFLWLSWTRARRGLRQAEGRLVGSEVDRDLWRARATKLLNGLGAEIDAQFDHWALTPAERQVALLLLKGLGHKAAADVLARSERTVRQHAVSVYRKSGLAGRAELSAFFLEDLLLPAQVTAVPLAASDSSKSDGS